LLPAPVRPSLMVCKGTAYSKFIRRPIPKPICFFYPYTMKLTEVYEKERKRSYYCRRENYFLFQEKTDKPGRQILVGLYAW